ncbi:hypothetical protein [Thermaerobacter litoralis]
MALAFEAFDRARQNAILRLLEAAVSQAAGRPLVVAWNPGRGVFEVRDDDGKPANDEPVQQTLRRSLRRIQRWLESGQLEVEPGQLLQGRVERISGRDVWIEVGGALALLPAGEQIPGENYEPGMLLPVYLLARTDLGDGLAELKVSRTHPQLVARLLERIVPEVAAGGVRILGIVRAPGEQAKVAVVGDMGQDPVGACVGVGGYRIALLRESLAGERIEVIRWDPDPAKFVQNALAPVPVDAVVLDPDRGEALVIVPPAYVAQAIGSHGRNVRLASRLTGWRITVSAHHQAALPRSSGWLDATVRAGTRRRAGSA